MELWIPITIAAAFLQNLRSALQKHLQGKLGTRGASFVRFGYGFPLAILYALVLPGRKFIFTNGSVKHAEMAAKALGIFHHFDDVFDIVAAEYVPKPAGATYDKFMALHRVDTTHAVMFEDLPRNLVVPKALGMKTVLLTPRDAGHEFVDAWEKRTEEDQHIDYATSDLTGFLNALL